MSLLSDNVIPGGHGKIFGTDAQKQEDLDRIITALKKMDGISDVIIGPQKFPKEFIVHTSKMVKINEIEAKINALGFHSIPKWLFEL